jgi:CHAD domain-containing protein
MAVDAKTTPSVRQERLARLATGEGLLRLFAQRREELYQNYALYLQQEGEEALHDLRVSLRRLHSLLRNYENAITNGYNLAKHLHDLQQQTNATRNLEVFISQLKPLCAQQSKFFKSLHQQLKRAHRQLRLDIPQQWEMLLPLLEPPPSVIIDERKNNTLGSLTASIGRQQLRGIKKGFSSLQHRWDEARLHRLRIRGKRFRYLLEPFFVESGVSKALSTLKHFQEEIGAYRDRQLLLQHLTEKSQENKGDTVSTALIEALQAPLPQLEKQAKRYRKRHKQQKFLKPLRHALRQLKHH